MEQATNKRRTKKGRIPRPETLYVRVTEAEKLQIETAVVGVSVVEWCRQKLLDAAERFHNRKDSNGEIETT